MRTETACIHAGGRFDPATRGINTPIYTSSAYEYLDGEARPYPRYFNTPNQAAVVGKLCALESAEDGLVLSSGMAAISSVLLALLGSGDHAVIQDEIYGGTHAMVSQHFERLGIAYTLAPAEPGKLVQAVTGKTRLIYIETPTNPLLTILDIRAVTRMARERGIVTVIDNTFASPINQRPIELGVDVVVHSGTKYLGGHSDLCAGAVLSNRSIIERVRHMCLSLGGSLDAQSCYLLERSLRVERQSANALAIARSLAASRFVSRVNYPGLPSHLGHETAKAQMSGFGAMLSFELADPVATDRFLHALKLIRPALSLGGVESTICAPATTSHAKVSAEVRKRLGISDGLLRLSVGIEHADDLVADLEQAMEGGRKG
ncbi:MAG: PLP-dependent aspartate aminotransferase family protein [Spirochaetes bacterium]|nr:PLP-dependent aspartate aminotransferase family protein [Spirochaetota bacterium]